MPRGVSDRTREIVYDALVFVYGETCYKCGTETPGERLYFHHVDGNDRNWTFRNLLLFCVSCNTGERNRRHPKPRKWDPSKSRRTETDIRRTETDPPSSYESEFRRTGIPAMPVADEQPVSRVPFCEIKTNTDMATARGAALKEVAHYETGSSEQQANMLFEEDYREWLLRTVDERGYLPKRQAINGGAEIVQCNPTTARGYYDKLTSEWGPLQELRGPFGQINVVRRGQQALPEPPEPEQPPGPVPTADTVDPDVMEDMARRNQENLRNRRR